MGMKALRGCVCSLLRCKLEWRAKEHESQILNSTLSRYGQRGTFYSTANEMNCTSCLNIFWYQFFPWVMKPYANYTAIICQFKFRPSMCRMMVGRQSKMELSVDYTIAVLHAFIFPACIVPTFRKARKGQRNPSCCTKWCTIRQLGQATEMLAAYSNIVDSLLWFEIIKRVVCMCLWMQEATEIK